MTAPLNSEGVPLGFCESCFRMRWISRVREMVKGVPYGTCTQCVREESE